MFYTLLLSPLKSQVIQWVGDNQLLWLLKDFVKGQKKNLTS